MSEGASSLGLDRGEWWSLMDGERMNPATPSGYAGTS